MNQRIFAFVLLFSLVSPLTFERHQPLSLQFLSTDMKEKYTKILRTLSQSLQPLSAKICSAGYSRGNTIGVLNNMNMVDMKYSGQYLQTGKLLQQKGGLIISPKKNSLWAFSKIARTASGSSGCIVYQVLPTYGSGSLVIQYDNSWSQGAYAHVCIRKPDFKAKTCFKDINVNAKGCIKFTNPANLMSSVTQKQIQQFYQSEWLQDIVVSVNVTLSITDGCKVQQIAVVVK